MSTLLVAGTVSRELLELTPLQLENIGVYRIVAAGPGSLAWRRNRATSEFVHGGPVVSAVKDVMNAPLVVRVYGTTAANLESRTATLLRAFEQFSYELKLVLGGVVHEWLCEPADYGPGEAGEYDPHYLRALQHVYRFSIPRQPVPITGSM